MSSPESDSSFPPRPTALLQTILSPIIQLGDWVIDATAGNGHDSLFLAEQVGPTGKVFAFDIQAEAIRTSSEQISRAGFAARVEFHQESHTMLETHAAARSVALVMFNLGYLPGGDHQQTTTTATTLVGLAAAARVLKVGGILSVICYPGHPAGATEAQAVIDWLAEKTASARWRLARYELLGTRRPAPVMLIAAVT